MKKIITAIIGLIAILFLGYSLMGCCDERSRRHSTSDYKYVVKVCSLGDRDGSSCVKYYVNRIVYDTPTIDLYTNDGDHLMYNFSGWSILVVRKD